MRPKGTLGVCRWDVILNAVLDQLGQPFTIRYLCLLGGFATKINIELWNRFEVGTSTGVVRVSRGVLSLESVP